MPVTCDVPLFVSTLTLHWLLAHPPPPDELPPPPPPPPELGVW
jgi:hypothetical protein